MRCDAHFNSRLHYVRRLILNLSVQLREREISGHLVNKPEKALSAVNELTGKVEVGLVPVRRRGGRDT